MAVVLRQGHSLGQLADELHGLPNSDEFTLTKAQLVSAQIRTAVNGQAEGLWIVAVVAGIAALVAMGQLIVRQVRPSGGERATLEAIGFTQGQRALGLVGHAAVPIVVVCTLGAVGATLPSAIFPTGFVARVEPSPGFRVEAWVLAGGAMILAAGLLASVTLVLAVGDPPPRPKSSRGWAWLARWPTGPVATGARFAFSVETGERTTIWGATLGMIVGVACLVGAFGFGASLDRPPTSWRSVG